MESKLIVIEGIDRTGKTTLMSCINKLTNYKHCVIDRGIISTLAYGLIYQRDFETLCGLTELEREFSKIKNHLIIYVDCDTDVIQQRINDTQHEYVDIEMNKNAFETILKDTTLNVVRVNTTNNTSEKIVEELINRGLI